MIIRPTGDNIVVKVVSEKAAEVTQSGIFIPKPKNDQPRPDMAEVIAVGSGRILMNGDIVKPGVETGERVVFNKFAGTEITVGDEMFLIIKENDILAIVE
jgi:chaperonin GroES